MYVDKAPCPPPEVSPDMFYAVAHQNNIPQNIADQIRWRCNVKDAPTSFAGNQDTASSNVGLIVGVSVATVAALVFVAVVMCKR